MPREIHELRTSAIPGPAHVIYEPVPEDVADPHLRQLYRRWLADLAAGLAGAGREILGYPEVAPLLRSVMLLELVKDDPFRFDYRYRIYGPEIARRNGRDMTGRLASEFSKGVFRFFAEIYEAAIIRKIVVHSLHPPPGDPHVLKWERLIFPLGEPEIKWLLVVAIAMGKPPETDSLTLEVPDPR